MTAFGDSWSFLGLAGKVRSGKPDVPADRRERLHLTLAV